MIKLSDDAKKAYAKYVGPDGKLIIDDSLSDEEKEEARLDYMEKLIANSGGEIGTIGSSSSRAWRKYGYN